MSQNLPVSLSFTVLRVKHLSRLIHVALQMIARTMQSGSFQSFLRSTRLQQALNILTHSNTHTVPASIHTLHPNKLLCPTPILSSLLSLFNQILSVDFVSLTGCEFTFESEKLILSSHLTSIVTDALSSLQTVISSFSSSLFSLEEGRKYFQPHSSPLLFVLNNTKQLQSSFITISTAGQSQTIQQQISALHKSSSSSTSARRVCTRLIESVFKTVTLLLEISPSAAVLLFSNTIPLFFTEILPTQTVHTQVQQPQGGSNQASPLVTISEIRFAWQSVDQNHISTVLSSFSSCLALTARSLNTSALVSTIVRLLELIECAFDVTVIQKAQASSVAPLSHPITEESVQIGLDLLSCLQTIFVTVSPMVISFFPSSLLNSLSALTFAINNLAFSLRSSRSSSIDRLPSILSTIQAVLQHALQLQSEQGRAEQQEDADWRVGLTITNDRRVEETEIVVDVFGHLQEEIIRMEERPQTEHPDNTPLNSDDQQLSPSEMVREEPTLTLLTEETPQITEQQEDHSFVPPPIIPEHEQQDDSEPEEVMIKDEHQSNQSLPAQSSDAHFDLNMENDFGIVDVGPDEDDS
ncbi:hypothetical protein BLNAU_6271 [Blattamonas nauphoetae]|uniref:Pre-rRNA-processing protein RIX1 n=1 Tax=Blattamonas nauphoetae TaxID=2049346 RepID=A0ABQ9Y4U7_9EUKA|nr:hypothetical protein BLNAU_6271 [Blattamonas nauphoetae]